jgi:hypothetical protein
MRIRGKAQRGPPVLRSASLLFPDSLLLPEIFDRRLEVAEQASRLHISSGRGVVAALKVESGGRWGFSRGRWSSRPSADEFLGAHAGIFVKARPSPILGVADQPCGHQIEVNVKQKPCKTRARWKARANSLKSEKTRTAKAAVRATN